MTGTENEKLPSSYYREQFIKLSLMTAITTVLMGILTVFVLVSRNSWRNGLKEKVNLILEENDSEFRADEWIKLSSNLTSQMSAYTVDGKNNKGIYAVICRTQSLYGPLASVYIFDSNKNKTSFIDFADIPPKIKNTLTNIAEKNQNAYWEKKIPLIISAAVGEDKE